MAYPEIKCVKNTLGGYMQKWEHVDGEKKKKQLEKISNRVREEG